MSLNIPSEVTLAQLNTISGSLQSQIVDSNIGVQTINNSSGRLVFSGSGLVSVTSIGQIFTINGDNSISGYVNSISGALQSQIVASGGTQVKITGSSVIPIADFTGIGGTIIFWSGSRVIISGSTSSGGGIGDVTYFQLTGLSGFLQNPPTIYLNGSNLLKTDTLNVDSFNQNRTFSFFGTSGSLNVSFIKLYANITNPCTINYPVSYRIGEFGATTGTFFPKGNHQISWFFVNSKWWVTDSAGVLSNLGDSISPTGYNDITSGYNVGSQWLNTGETGLYYCINSTSGNALWKKIVFM